MQRRTQTETESRNERKDKACLTRLRNSCFACFVGVARAAKQYSEAGRNTKQHGATAETHRETNLLRVAAISKHFDIAETPKPPKHVRNKSLAIAKHTPQHRSTTKHGATEILEGYPLKSQKYPSKCRIRAYRAETHPQHNVSGMFRRAQHPFSQNRPKFRHVTTCFGLFRPVTCCFAFASCVSDYPLSKQCHLARVYKAMPPRM